MTVDEYLEMPYNYIIQKMKDESGEYYYAHVLELDGCQSDGDTFDEAYNSLREAMRGYIQTKLDNGVDIPLPHTTDDYSGKFVVRVPKSLHQALTIEAAREGVSLNQYALYKLSR